MLGRVPVSTMSQRGWNCRLALQQHPSPARPTGAVGGRRGGIGLEEVRGRAGWDQPWLSLPDLIPCVRLHGLTRPPQFSICSNVGAELVALAAATALIGVRKEILPNPEEIPAVASLAS